jgi:hypothetical protein
MGKLALSRGTTGEKADTWPSLLIYPDGILYSQYYTVLHSTGPGHFLLSDAQSSDDFLLQAGRGLDRSEMSIGFAEWTVSCIGLSIDLKTLKENQWFSSRCNRVIWIGI